MSYKVITPENIQEVAKQFRRGKGRLFIAESGNGFWGGIADGGHWCLYDKPILDASGSFHTKRGSKVINGESWQTNWENDRNYLLRRIPKPKNDPLWNYCRELANKHVFQDYEFKIGFQDCVGRGLGNLNLYIPREESPSEAFNYGLAFVINNINQHLGKQVLSPEDIEALVEKMTSDLQDRVEFMHNVNAGVVADQILGM